MFSSEQTFTIDGDKKENLVEVLNLAYKLLNTTSPACFKETENHLILSLSDYDVKYGFQKYPFKVNTTMLCEQIYDWLKTVGYPDPQDIDGSIYRGWEVFCPKWFGDDKIEQYTLSTNLAVRPKWIYYGK